MFGWFGKKSAPTNTARSPKAPASTSPASQSAASQSPAFQSRASQSRASSAWAPRIDGEVDPRIIERAAGAVHGRQASDKMKRLVDDPKGAQAMAGTLRRWMNEGRK